ncbi:nitroreductase [Alkalihalophilus pseudofirmus]|nr:nitroreductase [Alkalihalophilus pseudofirmus]
MGLLTKFFGESSAEANGGNQATDFYSAVEARRSIYGISKEAVVSDARIQELIEHAVKHTPSAFNAQTQRVVVLLGEHHDKLWDITTETLKKVVPENDFADTQGKMDAFRSGYGTILFFEEQSIIESLQEQFPTYEDKFPVWSSEGSGMLQYVVWTSLELEGYGVNLQHYNPLIDEEVKQQWGIPTTWKLTAQMPFGKPTTPAGAKEFQPIEERMKVFK